MVVQYNLSNKFSVFILWNFCFPEIQLMGLEILKYCNCTERTHQPIRKQQSPYIWKESSGDRTWPEFACEMHLISKQTKSSYTKILQKPIVPSSNLSRLSLKCITLLNLIKIVLQILMLLRGNTSTNQNMHRICQWSSLTSVSVKSIYILYVKVFLLYSEYS